LDSLPIFKITLEFFAIELGVACVFLVLISCQKHDLQAFSPTLWAAFLLCEQCLLIHKFLKFSCSPTDLFLSVVTCAFGVPSKETLPSPMS